MIHKFVQECCVQCNLPVDDLERVGWECLGHAESAIKENSLSASGDASSKSSGEAKDDSKLCPYCSETIRAIAVKCKHCGEFLEGAKSPHSASVPIAQIIKDGHFSFSCTYNQAYAMVERAMEECEVKIKERNPKDGLLKGNCKYGINLFGITVTSVFCSDAGIIQVEITATLSDALDTFGICKKKVGQISERVRSLAAVGPPTQSASEIPTLPNELPLEVSPPSYAERAGPSHKGKAITGLCFSIGGLFFGPASIFGVIMSAVAINGMSTSSNKEGQGAALAGIVIGLISATWWLLILLGQ